MIDEFEWFERQFTFDLPPWMFPNIVERLRGTPIRVEMLTADVEPLILTKRLDDAWSIQENVGHLWDLEPLWLGRVGNILDGVETMREADLSNRKTHEADHNTASLIQLIGSFQDERTSLIARLDVMDEKTVLKSALHPRLGQPMRLIDLAFFVAEHDDHHLAQITRLKRSYDILS